jgi:hypothetical protein
MKTRSRGYARKGLCSIAAFAVISVMQYPAKANTITYDLVNVTASFSIGPGGPTGPTSFTLNLDGTFTYDTTSQVVTGVNINLSGPIPAIYSQFETYNYSAPFTGIVSPALRFRRLMPRLTM